MRKLYNKISDLWPRGKGRDSLAPRLDSGPAILDAEEDSFSVYSWPSVSQNRVIIDKGNVVARIFLVLQYFHGLQLA